MTRYPPIIALLAALAGMCTSAAGATFTVINTNDSGQGSLRQAILDANVSNTSPDIIVFNIPGTGPHRIAPVTALPIITGPTVIDGFSQQTGASRNTLAVGNNAVLKVELSGPGVTSGTTGLHFNFFNCAVRGLVINGFATGIIVNGANGIVDGCFIGTDVTGTAARPNGEGIRVNLNGDTAVIGGTTAAARNLISGNSTRGVHINASALNVSVQGNYIGTNAQGTAALPNGEGVILTTAPDIGSPNTAIIGGTAAGAGNLISGNSRNGITVNASSSGVIIRGNRIGTAADGVKALGNLQHGIEIAVGSPSNTSIGGTSAGEGNVIAYNGRDGISATVGAGTRILGNSIHTNGSTQNDLGIDLGPDGVTANDPSDSDSGPNGLQNFPLITSVTSGNGVVQIAGSLNSSPQFTFRIEFFRTGAADPSRPLQGRTFIGSTTVTADFNGNASFNVTFQTPATDGQITATATDPNGNTSEFSPPVLAITSPRGMVVNVGTRVVYQIETTGATSVDAANLAPGLSVDRALGAIVGTPTQQGSFQIRLSASNSGGSIADTLFLTVLSPSSGPIITSNTAATGRTGAPFRFQVITTGGSSATRLSAFNVPAGLSVDPVTGIITGTPTSDGSFAVELTATDGNRSNTANLQLTFTSDSERPVIVSPSEAMLGSGEQFSYTIVAPSTAPSSDPTTYQIIGALPQGLGFSPSSGTISGTFTGGSAARGKPLSGGVITNVQIFARNSNGTSTLPLVFFLKPSGVVNISTRLAVGTDQNVLIGGFIVTGNAPKKLIVRGIGPSLQAGGVPVAGAMQDPRLEVREGATLLGENDDWRSSQENEIIATTIPPSDNREPALVGILNPGAYTAIMSGKDGSTGIGLVEVFDLGTASLEASSNARLANISTRGFVQQGDNVMIGGFIVSGSASRVIVRGIGPSLSASGVVDALQDTTIDLLDGNGSLIVANDNWREGGQDQEIIDTGVPPGDDRESAIVANLNPGAYTAVLRGKDGRTGVALVEAFVLQ